jgi:hypothetical protein
MSLTEFQQFICRLIARNRVEQGESYVAGGVALNLLTGGGRISKVIDLFRDTEDALDKTWASDRALLHKHGFAVHALRERAGYIEAEVAKGSGKVLVQWTRDSAYRFFPLVAHEHLGLTLHPFDLATNEVLALIGRLEARDWVDVVTCHDRVQPPGYLAWAACGKDPAFGPASILEEASRSSRYTQTEIDELEFAGSRPDAASLFAKWQEILRQARDIVTALPADRSGMCVLDRSGALSNAGAPDLLTQLENNAIVFHAGSIRGAYPQIVK